MKIYLSAFADEASKDFPGQLEALKRNNIGLIEVRSADGKNVSAFTLDEARKYREMMDEKGIKVWSVGSPVAKTVSFANIDRQTEKAKHVCDIADIFSADNIRAFSFMTVSNSLDRKRVFSKVGDLCSLITSRGKNYCLENDSGLYGNVPSRIFELLEAFPDMKYIYDPANFIMSGQDPEITIPALAGKAHYYHIKDARGKKVVPAGYGSGRISDVVDMMKDGCVCTIEPHLFAYRGEKDGVPGGFDLSTRCGKFDCAVYAFKKLLEEKGFTERDGYFERGDTD